MPTACTASVCRGTPCSWATSASSRTGFTVPTSLFAHITDTSAARSGASASAARRVAGCTPAVPVDGQRHDVRALVLGEPLGRLEHGVVLDLGDEHAGAARVGGPARPVQALDGEVVALRAAGGEHHLRRPRADRRGDPLAGLLDEAARPAARGVQRRGVAGARQRLGHHRHGLRQHRRGGGVVEVGGARFCAQRKWAHGFLAVPSVCRGSRVDAAPRAGRGYGGDDDVVPVVAPARVELAPARHQTQHGAGRRAVDQRRREGVLGVALDGDDPVVERPPSERETSTGSPGRARRGGRRRPGPPASRRGRRSPSAPAPRHGAAGTPATSGRRGTSTRRPRVEVDEGAATSRVGRRTSVARSTGPTGRRGRHRVERLSTGTHDADAGEAAGPSTATRRQTTAAIIPRRSAARPAGRAAGTSGVSVHRRPAGTAPRPARSAPAPRRRRRRAAAGPGRPRRRDRSRSRRRAAAPAPRVTCGSRPSPLSISRTVWSSSLQRERHRVALTGRAPAMPTAERAVDVGGVRCRPTPVCPHRPVTGPTSASARSR